MLFQNTRSNLEGLREINIIIHLWENHITLPNLVHKVNDRAAFQFGSGVAELLEGNEARVWVTEDTMTVSV